MGLALEEFVNKGVSGAIADAVGSKLKVRAKKKGLKRVAGNVVTS